LPEKANPWQLSCEQAGDATLSSAAAGPRADPWREPVRVSFLNVRGEVTACAGRGEHRVSGGATTAGAATRDVAVHRRMGWRFIGMYRDLASESWFVEARYD